MRKYATNILTTLALISNHCTGTRAVVISKFSTNKKKFYAQLTSTHDSSRQFPSSSPTVINSFIDSIFFDFISAIEFFAVSNVNLNKDKRVSSTPVASYIQRMSVHIADFHTQLLHRLFKRGSNPFSYQKLQTLQVLGYKRSFRGPNGKDMLFGCQDEILEDTTRLYRYPRMSADQC